MNPLMMIPHKYKYRKTHPGNDPTATATTIRYINTQEQDQQKLYCHSPPISEKKSANVFVQSSNVEDYDAYSWFE